MIWDDENDVDVNGRITMRAEQKGNDEMMEMMSSRMIRLLRMIGNLMRTEESI